MNDRIATVDAWEVLDSRGNPTVAAEVTLASGASGSAAVPSGASTGRFEAYELRDGGTRYAGKGVRRAVANVRGELADAVRGLDAADQRALDRTLRDVDGTPNLARLGANATLAVSIAASHAVAAARGVPLWRHLADESPRPLSPLLPLPMVNIVSGGAHAGGAIDIQDVLAIPLSARCFADAIEAIATVRRNTAAVAEGLGLPAALVADEGGIAGRLPSNRAALELVTRGIEASGYAAGDDIALAIDVAANQLADSAGSVPVDRAGSVPVDRAGSGPADRAGSVAQAYRLEIEDRSLTAEGLVDEVAGWVRDFPIVSVEDVLADTDTAGWPYASESLTDIQLLGDDLFATNVERLRSGISAGIANAVLVKPNQAGTLTDALDVVTAARAAGYATVISARSGETEDTWLADLAVGWRCGQLKVGSTTRSDRTAKWNRLLRLEHQLGDRATYAGPAALAR